MVNENAYHELMAQLKEKKVELIAVSKFKTVEDIAALYALGQRDFGENYVQELVEKQHYFANKVGFEAIRWHFIGHLQRNKVKYIAPFIHLIHGVDSFKLLQEINKEAQKNNRSIHCLLQIHIATEVSKFGLDNAGAFELMQYYTAQQESLQNVVLQGVMGMASFSEDLNQVKAEFAELKAAFSLLKSNFSLFKDDFRSISMGMSNDYQLAIAEGSNMVRIGSLLFGNR